MSDGSVNNSAELTLGINTTPAEQSIEKLETKLNELVAKLQKLDGNQQVQHVVSPEAGKEIDLLKQKIKTLEAALDNLGEGSGGFDNVESGAKKAGAAMVRISKVVQTESGNISISAKASAANINKAFGKIGETGNTVAANLKASGTRLSADIKDAARSFDLASANLFGGIQDQVKREAANTEKLKASIRERIAAYREEREAKASSLAADWMSQDKDIIATQKQIAIATRAATAAMKEQAAAAKARVNARAWSDEEILGSVSTKNLASISERVRAENAATQAALVADQKKANAQREADDKAYLADAVARYKKHTAEIELLNKAKNNNNRLELAAMAREEAAALKALQAIKAGYVFNAPSNLTGQGKQVWAAQQMLANQGANAAAQVFNQAVISAIPNISQYEKAVKQAGSAQNTLANHVKSSADHMVNWNKVGHESHSLARGLAGSMNALWLTWGSTVPLLAGAALGSSFVQAAKQGSEFAYQLTFVKALSNEAASSVDNLSRSAIALSKGGLYAPTEIAGGFRMLAQAGLDVTKSLVAMPEVLRLATVGEMSMSDAAVTLVGVMNAFGGSVADVSHIGDVFAKAAAVSQTSVQAMTEAMKTASVVGEQYGASVEDTATALTMLAKVNITGTAAGTSLRNMLKELYTPTDNVAKVMTNLGLKAADAQGNLRAFPDIIYDLKTRLSEFDRISQINILQKLFGERGAKEAIAMLSYTREEWDKLNATIGQSEGFMAGVSAQLEQTTKGQFLSALNTLKASLLETFNGAESSIRGVAEALKSLAGSDFIKVALEGIVGTMAALATVAIQAAPALITLGTALLALKGAALLSVGFQTLAATISVVSSVSAFAGGGLAGLRLGLLATSAAAGQAAGAAGLGGMVTALGALNPLSIAAVAAVGGLAYGFYDLFIKEGPATAAARDFTSALADQLSKLRETNSELERRLRLQSGGSSVDRKGLEKTEGDLEEVRSKLKDKDTGVLDRIRLQREEKALQEEIFKQRRLISDGYAEEERSLSNKLQVSLGDYTNRIKDFKASGRKVSTSQMEGIIQGYRDYRPKTEAEVRAVTGILEAAFQDVQKSGLATGSRKFSEVTGKSSDKGNNEALRANIVEMQGWIRELSQLEKQAQDELATSFNEGTVTATEYWEGRLELANSYTALEIAAIDGLISSQKGLSKSELAQLTAKKKLLEVNLDGGNEAARDRAKSESLSKLKLSYDKVIASASKQIALYKNDTVFEALSRQTDEFGRQNLEVERSVEAFRLAEIAKVEALNLANRQNKDLTASQLAGIDAITEAERQALMERLNLKRQHEGNWLNGVDESWKAWKDSANNAAKIAGQSFSTIFKKVDDVMLDFIRTGKLNFKSLGQTIKDEVIKLLYELTVKKFVIGIAGDFSGLAMAIGGTALRSILGVSGSGGSSGGGTDYLGMASNASSAYNLYGAGNAAYTAWTTGAGALPYTQSLASLGTYFGKDGLSSLISMNPQWVGATQVGANPALTAYGEVLTEQLANLTTAIDAAVEHGMTALADSLMAQSAELTAELAAVETAAAAEGTGTGAASSAGGAVAGVLAILAGMYLSGEAWKNGYKPDGDWHDTGDLKTSPLIIRDIEYKINKALWGEDFAGSKFLAMVTGSSLQKQTNEWLLNGIFGGEWQPENKPVLAGGISDSGGFYGDVTQQFKKDGGWFRSDKQETRSYGVDPSLGEYFNAAYTTLKSSLVLIGSVFEDTSIADKLKNFSFTFQRNMEGSQMDVATSIVKEMFGYMQKQVYTSVTEINDGLKERLVSLNTALADATESGDTAAVEQIKAQIAASTETWKQTLTRVQNEVVAVTNVFGLLGTTLKDAFGLGDLNKIYLLSDSFVQLFGSIDAMNTSINAYYGNFYTEAEKQERSWKGMGEAFKSMNLTMPTTREGFRDLVEAQDMTTVAGQQTFVALMNVQSAFADLVPVTAAVVAETAAVVAETVNLKDTLAEMIDGLKTAVQDAMDSVTAAYDRDVDNVNSSYEATMKPVQAAIDAAQKIYDDIAKDVQAKREAAQRELDLVMRDVAAMLKPINEQISGMSAKISAENDRYNTEMQLLADERKAATKAYNDAIKGLPDAIDKLRSAVDKVKALRDSLTGTLDGLRIQGSEASYRTDAQAQIRNALAVARSTGVLPESESLSSALSTISQPSEDLFATFEDYARDFYRTAIDIRDLNDIAGDQLSVTEPQLAALEAMKETLETNYAAQTAAFDAQQETLTGIHDTLLKSLESQLKFWEDLKKIQDDRATVAQEKYNTTSQGLDDQIYAAAEALKTALAPLNTQKETIEKDWAAELAALKATYDEAVAAYKAALKIDENIGTLAGNIITLANAIAGLNAGTGDKGTTANPTPLNQWLTAANGTQSYLDPNGASALRPTGGDATATLVSGKDGNTDTLQYLIDAANALAKSGAYDKLIADAANKGIGSDNIANIINNGTGNTVTGTDVTNWGAETVAGYKTNEMKQWVQDRLAAGNARAVYDRAVAEGISSATLDGIMGWSLGTALQWATGNGLPAFAKGTNYVPGDMLAQIHQGERIIPAADNSLLMSMLNNGGRREEALVEEIKALRQEVKQLREENMAAQTSIATNTRKSAQILDEFNEIGMPEVRT